MTVQQARRTGAPETTTTSRPRLPEQRRQDHDAVEAAPPPAAPQLRGWGSAHDRTMARWLMVMAVALGLYVALFITMGTRVWG